LPDSVREAIQRWLSRAMFAVAAVAAGSLIAQYGFYLNERQLRFLSMVDLAVIGIFMLDAVLRFALARRKLRYLRGRWPALTIVGLIIVQLFLVSAFKGRGMLPSFMAGSGVFSLAKGYIIVLQVYLVFLIIGEAVRANRSIASTPIAPARTVIASFVLIVILGALLLATPRATVGRQLSPVDSFFTATSAVCVTGLIVVDTGSHFTRFGHAIILVLIQIGGLGLITFATFFATVLRGGLGVRESLLLRGMMTFETIGRIGRTLRYVIGITFVMEAAGALLLFAATRADFPTIGHAARASVFHSISAFCNAGFSLNATSFERYASNVPVNLVMTSLIVIGGLGFPVLMAVLHKYPLLGRRDGALGRWPLHVRMVAIATVLLLVVGTLGFKTVSIGLVLASMRSMFLGTRRVELFRRRVPDWQVNEALVVVSMGILVVAGGTLVLLAAEDLTLSEVLFEVVSAFGTVGLSTGVTPTLSVVGKLALILIMLAGRVGPLTLALALAQRSEKPLYDYPEETVVIG